MISDTVRTLIAESATLDRPVTSIYWFFLSIALPGLVGLMICRRGKGARAMAFVLGIFSPLTGVCQLGWIIQGRSTVPTFYLTTGAPLLVGVAACVSAGTNRRPPGPSA